jgi:hypothetical protein
MCIRAEEFGFFCWLGRAVAPHSTVVARKVVGEAGMGVGFRARVGRNARLSPKMQPQVGPTCYSTVKCRVTRIPIFSRKSEFSVSHRQTVAPHSTVVARKVWGSSPTYPLPPSPDHGILTSGTHPGAPHVPGDDSPVRLHLDGETAHDHARTNPRPVHHPPPPLPPHLAPSPPPPPPHLPPTRPHHRPLAPPIAAGSYPEKFCRRDIVTAAREIAIH